MPSTTAQSIVSKNIRGSAELVFLADILPGFVEISEPVTYGTRLRRLLKALYELRKEGVERMGSGFVGPLERLETLHFVNWCVIDGRIHDDGRIDNEQLLLVATFDQPWEPYIRRIVDQAGPLLDLIFAHCVGFEGHSSRYGYDKFAAFVREHQRETHYFAGGNPECSVDDVRYFQALAGLRETNAPDSLLQAAIGALDPRVPDSNELDRLFRLLGELHETRRFYPEIPAGASLRADPISDRDYYDAAAGLLLKGFVPRDPAKRSQTLQAVQGLVANLASNHRNLAAYYGQQLQRLQQQKPKKAVFAALRGKPQGAILTRNAEKTHGCLLLLRFLDTAVEAALTKARAVLEEHEGEGVSWTVSFTYQGLSKLVSPKDLAWLPQEFRLGMEARAGLLGDIGKNHPSVWRRPKLNAGAGQDTELSQNGEVDLATVDVAIQLSANRESRSGDHRWDDRHPFWLIFEQLAAVGGVQVLHVQPLRRYAERKQADGVFKEHFGFLDGLSQPDPLQEPSDPRFAAPLGDFLLGYPDGHGDQVDCPPIFDNGSFLVVRKLRQNVKDFEAFLDRATQTPGLELSKDELRGYLIGRDTKGIPLGVEPAQGNDFNYDGDVQGRRCPLQAHARRANPRLPLTCSAHDKPMVTPRILRRGFPYGPEQPTEGGDDQGLLFLAYNARIAEQFEVLQRWINGANITGLSSDQNDALVGSADPSGPRRFTFQHGNQALSVELPRDPFVTLEWGMYLFTPSLPALSELAQGQVGHGLIQARRADGDAREGEELIQRLRAIENGSVSSEDQGTGANDPSPKEVARLAWKKILEDEDSERQAASIWAAIRKGTGVLKTPYGILVGSAQPARAVLNDESLFSVREYWARMTESFGPLYLGMDRKVSPEVVCPSGRDAAYVAADAAGEIRYDYNAAINAELSGIKRQSAFKETLSLARTALAQARRKASSQDEATIDLTLLAEQVVGQLSTLWFGFPDPAAAGSPSPPLLIQGEPEPLEEPKVAYCPYDFTVASQHIFRPNPDPWAIRASRIRGKAAQDATQAFLTAAQVAPTHPFLKSLFAQFPNDLNAVRQGLIGAVDGFVAATYGSFVSVIDRWIEEGTLTTMQRQYGALLREDPSQVVDAPSRFVDEIHATMKRRPVPPTVYRTALAATDLGDVQVQPGDRVVVYLGSAAHLQRDDELLFGGTYETKKGERDAVHACPGRELAIGVLCGLFAALFERANLRREDRLILSFHP